MESIQGKGMASVDILFGKEQKEWLLELHGHRKQKWELIPEVQA